MLRRFSTRVPPVSALSLFKNSCYHKIDFKIPEDQPVQHAIAKFTAFNIGCLAVTNPQNHVVGVLSERDYIHKVSALNKYNSGVKIKDVCTYAPSMISARENDTIEQCMNKMLLRDYRHLLVLDEQGRHCIGLISMKDVIKELMRDKNNMITRLSNFNTGKGGFFGSE